jgi:hypothetical protein
MPTTSPKATTGLKSLARRYGPKAAIIAVGFAFAVGSLQDTRFLPKPKVIERPFADVLAPKVAATVDAATKPWAVLDAGVEHDRIATWIGRLTGSQKYGVEKTLAKKEQYEAMIARKLEERKMPADLIYLAMIESNFNTNATSRVKAKGMWQFMSATAREFGLTVRGKTDERTDPEKSTDAALTYLQSLKDRFGSWYLAAAAYNSGGGTVSKAMRKTVGRTKGTDEDFWLIMPNLPKETQDYVPKLIATARVGNDPARYGLKVQESGGTVDLSGVAAAPPKAAIADKVAASSSVVKKSAVKKSTVKKAAVKKPVVKKQPAKKPPAKKPTTRRP